MLYDPKWEKPADVFSLESLIAWLEKQPAAAKYDFENCKGGCLLDQYGDALGMANDYADHRYSKLSRAFECSAGHTYLIAVNKPHTYGAALERARSALTLQKCGDADADI